MFCCRHYFKDYARAKWARQTRFHQTFLQLTNHPHRPQSDPPDCLRMQPKICPLRSRKQPPSAPPLHYCAHPSFPTPQQRPPQLWGSPLKDHRRPPWCPRHRLPLRAARKCRRRGREGQERGEDPRRCHDSCRSPLHSPPHHLKNHPPRFSSNDSTFTNSIFTNKQLSCLGVVSSLTFKHSSPRRKHAAT